MENYINIKDFTNNNMELSDLYVFPTKPELYEVRCQSPESIRTGQPMLDIRFVCHHEKYMAPIHELVLPDLCPWDGYSRMDLVTRLNEQFTKVEAEAFKQYAAEYLDLDCRVSKLLLPLSYGADEMLSGFIDTQEVPDGSEVVWVDLGPVEDKTSLKVYAYYWREIVS